MALASLDAAMPSALATRSMRSITLSRQSVRIRRVSAARAASASGAAIARRAHVYVPTLQV